LLQTEKESVLWPVQGASTDLRGKGASAKLVGVHASMALRAGERRGAWRRDPVALGKELESGGGRREKAGTLDRGRSAGRRKGGGRNA
jgi:hypothetical protein